MPGQEHLRRPVAERTIEETEAATTAGGTGERLKAELDDLLDEIDEVLETNAEDFVRSFVQKGGE
jgi:ubiquitin-like protein Pup